MSNKKMGINYLINYLEKELIKEINSNISIKTAMKILYNSTGKIDENVGHYFNNLISAITKNTLKQKFKNLIEIIPSKNKPKYEKYYTHGDFKYTDPITNNIYHFCLHFSDEQSSSINFGSPNVLMANYKYGKCSDFIHIINNGIDKDTMELKDIYISDLSSMIANGLIFYPNSNKSNQIQCRKPKTLETFKECKIKIYTNYSSKQKINFLLKIVNDQKRKELINI
jgi:hypothetical protein